ncbi:N-acetylmuramic acid 6-phosphate etherase [Niabella sp. CC-SYL272]|uniref:N-acetylmuramic acid 6-phosphate etherase n=1 Tax=Niabella agricola TaxID=2891571 RepID=UPI001F27F18D|nr:N-acetylmuramic acid 6-phosphate etherase [Niabella agricola]MCF3108760.1 N-acetylmuramic acid 6-phosphate etherase [Niabella agricola]
MQNRITEQPSGYRSLEKKTTEELTMLINREDQRVAPAVEKELPRINALIEAIVAKITNGGRLFYVGAGSSGRLSVLDVIELPTTYGVSPDLFQVILAGGVDRLVEAREEMEDDKNEAWEKLEERGINKKDIVVGISASGTTPFVLAALTQCRKANIDTGCIVSNPDSPIAAQALYPVEVITGPEFITGSTRMKCATAHKMIFDMISTTTMVRLGRIIDNQMVNVKLINNKITDRATKMLMRLGNINDYDTAREILFRNGSVQNALKSLDAGNYPV